jgi:hypothetical protein
MAAERCRAYFHRVKHKKISRTQISMTAGASQSSLAELRPDDVDFAMAPHASAKKSYAGHVNQGSCQGHEVQHWLEAEAQLLAERKFQRVKFLHSVAI